MEPSNIRRTLEVLARWGQFDFMVCFLVPTQSTRVRDLSDFLLRIEDIGKPMAIVLVPSIVPAEAGIIFEQIKTYASAGYPLYFSFAGAANAINLALSHYERKAARQGMFRSVAAGPSRMTQITDR